MFLGTGTALITPFNEDFSVDYQSLRKVVEDQIKNGVSALIVLGTTGEASTINSDERKKIIKMVVDIAKGKTKIIAGTGSNDTMKVVEYNKIAEECKADAVLIVNPYYNKGTQNSLVEHYKYISERTSLPIIVYNVPSRTAMNILPETVLRIHTECKNVVGIKEACGDISQITRLMAMIPDTLSVYSGNDDQTIAMMSLGAKGVISVFSNVYPKEMCNLTTAVLNNNWNEVRSLNKKYLKMMNLLFIETSPMPVKFVASLRGLCKNVLRLPLTKISASSEKILIDEFEKFRG